MEISLAQILGRDDDALFRVVNWNNGQTQIDDGISVLRVVGIITGLRFLGSIGEGNIIALTDGLVPGKLACTSGVHHNLIDRVAAVHRKEMIRIGTRRRDVHTVERELFAFSDLVLFIELIGRVYRYFQFVDTIEAVMGQFPVIVNTRFGNDHILVIVQAGNRINRADFITMVRPTVRIRLTDIYRVFEVVRRMNLQMQVNDTVATVVRQGRTFVITRNRQIASVEVVGLLVGDMNRIPLLILRINTDDIADDRVATVPCRNGIEIVGTVRYHFIVDHEDISVTYGDMFLGVERLAYSQVQGLYHAGRVGPCDWHGVISALAVFDTAPYERQIIGADVCGGIDAELFEYGQNQLIGVHTSVGIELTMLVHTGLLVPRTVEQDGVTLVDTAYLRLVVKRLYLQRQHDDAVATVGSHQRVVVRSLLREHRFTELIEVALTDRYINRSGRVRDRQHGHFETNRGLSTFGAHYCIAVDTGLVDGHVFRRIARQVPVVG